MQTNVDTFTCTCTKEQRYWCATFGCIVKSYKRYFSIIKFINGRLRDSFKRTVSCVQYLCSVRRHWTIVRCLDMLLTPSFHQPRHPEQDHCCTCRQPHSWTPCRRHRRRWRQLDWAAPRSQPLEHAHLALMHINDIHKAYHDVGWWNKNILDLLQLHAQMFARNVSPNVDAVRTFTRHCELRRPLKTKAALNVNLFFVVGETIAWNIGNSKYHHFSTCMLFPNPIFAQLNLHVHVHVL